MTTSTTGSGDWVAATTRNTMRLGLWTAAWVSTMAVATFGPIFIWDFDAVPSLTVILVSVAVGFGMIVAHKRYLQGLDELQRKVQLEAMGLALGVGVVVGPAYSTLDVTNLITSDAEIGFLIVLMALTYMTAFFVGSRRYR